MSRLDLDIEIVNNKVKLQSCASERAIVKIQTDGDDGEITLRINDEVVLYLQEVLEAYIQAGKVGK